MRNGWSQMGQRLAVGAWQVTHTGTGVAGLAEAGNGAEAMGLVGTGRGGCGGKGLVAMRCSAGASGDGAVVVGGGGAGNLAPGLDLIVGAGRDVNEMPVGNVESVVGEAMLEDVGCATTVVSNSTLSE